jgi:hypothetical protein
VLDNRPRGLFCILLARDPVGNVPVGSPLSFGHFPQCIRYVNIAEMVSKTLQAFPKQLPMLCRHCSNGLQELSAHFPACFGVDFDFFYIFLEAACFCLFRLKIEDKTENFKTICSSSSNYDLSNHTIYSQTQMVRQVL